MKKFWLTKVFVLGDVKEIIAGPAMISPGAVKLGNNQSITQEEAEAFQAIQAAGYKVKFHYRCFIGYWDDFKSKFVFKTNSLIWLGK